MKDLAKIINFGRGDSLTFADAVDRAAADVIFVNQRVGALSTQAHGFPKLVVNNHAIT